MQLEPLYTIPLVYQLTDPADSGTYYVKSVMKDSLTGTTLGTTNLTSQGSGRYTGSLNAPQDPSGFGRHIDIVTTVYSDSGYTTFSDVYARKTDVYIIRKTISFGGASGVDIDYTKIRKIVDEIVTIKVGAIQIPVTDLTPVYARFEALDRAIEAIEPPVIPENKPTDLSPVLSELKKIVPAITNKIDKIDQPDEVDLSPVLTAIKEVSDSVIAKATSNRVAIDNISPEIIKELAKSGPEVIDMFKKELAKSMIAITQDPGGGIVVVETEPATQEKIEAETPRYFDAQVPHPEISKYFP